MNSWARSACYPRSTFYPLSDGPSTRDHRIIKPDFRLCSTCQSHSQASLCLYTRRLIAKQPEETFGRLRYILGGNRPSQTAHLSLSLDWFHRLRLEFQNNKSGISPSAPPKPEFELQSLPPILRILF